MYQRMVLAYDGSRDGRAALQQGADLASRCQARVYLVAVIANAADLLLAESVYPSGELIAQQLQEVELTLSEGKRCLLERGLEVETRLCRGQAVEEIAAVARDINADLIVVGHREQSTLARWWRGSVGQSLLAQTPCSVLVCVMNHA